MSHVASQLRFLLRDLVHWVTPHVLPRGLEYAQAGRVLSIRLDASPAPAADAGPGGPADPAANAGPTPAACAGEIVAQVAGRDRVYDVRVDLTHFPRSTCSCPYDEWCKHMVAVVVAAAEEMGMGDEAVRVVGEASAEVLLDEVARWSVEDLRSLLHIIARTHPAWAIDMRVMAAEWRRARGMADRFRDMSLDQVVRHFERAVAEVVREADRLVERWDDPPWIVYDPAPDTPISRHPAPSAPDPAHEGPRDGGHALPSDDGLAASHRISAHDGPGDSCTAHLDPLRTSGRAWLRREVRRVFVDWADGTQAVAGDAPLAAAAGLALLALRFDEWVASAPAWAQEACGDVAAYIQARLAKAMDQLRRDARAHSRVRLQWERFIHRLIDPCHTVEALLRVSAVVGEGVIDAVHLHAVRHQLRHEHPHLWLAFQQDPDLPFHLPADHATPSQQAALTAWWVQICLRHGEVAEAEQAVIAACTVGARALCALAHYFAHTRYDPATAAAYLARALEQPDADASSDAYEALARLYEAADQPDQAAQARAKAEALRGQS